MVENIYGVVAGKKYQRFLFITEEEKISNNQ